MRARWLWAATVCAEGAVLSGCLYRDIVRDEAEARAKFPDYEAARPHVLILQAERPGLSSTQAYCTLLPETEGCAEILADLVTQTRWERLLYNRSSGDAAEQRRRHSYSTAGGGDIRWDAYGLGVHADQYGRPVQIRPWP